MALLVRMMRGISPRGTVAAAALAVTLPVGVLGCGSQASTPTVSRAAPADLLLTPSALPTGFSVEQLSVPALVAANAKSLTAAAAATVSPSHCRPTADAALNPTLDETNAAILAAQSAVGSLVEVVTTRPRDIGADIAVTTGSCARTETTVTTGNLAGARIETTYRTLELPDEAAAAPAASVTLSHLASSVTRTSLPDGGVSTQLGYLGYAAVSRGANDSVTVSMTVSGGPGEAVLAPAEPAEPLAPMSAAEFAQLFADAVAAAAR